MDQRVPPAVAVIYDPADPLPLLGRPACPACLADHAASGYTYQYVPICPDPAAHHDHDHAAVDHSRPHPHHAPGRHDHPPGT